MLIFTVLLHLWISKTVHILSYALSGLRNYSMETFGKLSAFWKLFFCCQAWLDSSPALSVKPRSNSPDGPQSKRRPFQCFATYDMIDFLSAALHSVSGGACLPEPLAQSDLHIWYCVARNRWWQRLQKINRPASQHRNKLLKKNNHDTVCRTVHPCATLEKSTNSLIWFLLSLISASL